MATNAPVLDGRIFVAGHRGMVGSAILRSVSRISSDVLTRAHSELDLSNRTAVDEFFDRERPHYVFMAAAKVGGIHANSTFPGDFIYQNLAIQLNVLEAARRTGVKRLLFLGSSCVYPRECPQPIREDYLLTGPLEITNRAYAVAKISGIEMCGSYNRQYGTKFLAAMPSNLYGPNDNYDLHTSHVLPALIRKFHEATVRGDAVVNVWGTGSPRREFTYSDDVGDAAVFLLGLPAASFDSLLAQDQPLINVGTGEDITIRELADLVRTTVGFAGDIRWDASMPDGTYRKLLDVSRLQALGWAARTRLSDGLALAYEDYRRRSQGA